METNNADPRRAARIKQLMERQGVTANQIANRTGLAYSSVQHIIAGKPTARLAEVAKVLNTTADQLNGDSTAIDQLDLYNLQTAPVCIEPYRIELHSDQLKYDGRAMFGERGFVTILVHPPTADELFQSRFALFRRTGEERAIVSYVIADGDRLTYSRAGHPIGATLSPSDELLPDQDGIVLGALRRILNAPFLLDQQI